LEEDLLVLGWSPYPNQNKLSILPAYFLSIFPLPAGVARKLKRLQRDFLWDSLGGEPRHHLLNWKIICSSVSKGGLGIKNLVLFNKALLGKWLWKFVQEETSLWRHVIVEKYKILSGEGA
jgi:hypothetical protein